jgi:hypothetical protein
MAQTQNNLYKENIQTLCDMGYNSSVVAYAMQDSKSKSVEECLELLLSKEDYYKKKASKQ